MSKKTSTKFLILQARRELQSARRNVGRAWREIELAKLQLARSTSFRKV